MAAARRRVRWAAVTKITSWGCSASLGTVEAGARAGRQPKVYLSGGTLAAGPMVRGCRLADPIE
jgi:hypothetical protein